MIGAFLSSPLFGSVLTVAAFAVGLLVQRKTKFVLANPMLIAVLLVIGVLVLCKIPLEQYEAGGAVIQLFLAPATAVLAVSIYNQLAILKRYFVPVLAGCLVGSITSVVSVTALSRALGLDAEVAEALFAKSCTTAIALGITESRGGLVPVTVVALMITGISGAMFAPLLCKLFRIKNPVAQGLGIGACSHAIGTTRALEMGETQGALSGIAIGLAGLMTVILSAFL